jgi:hypothetical protein
MDAHDAPEVTQGTEEEKDCHDLQVDGYPRMCNPISNPLGKAHGR